MKDVTLDCLTISDIWIIIIDFIDVNAVAFEDLEKKLYLIYLKW